MNQKNKTKELFSILHPGFFAAVNEEPMAMCAPLIQIFTADSDFHHPPQPTSFLPVHLVGTFVKESNAEYMKLVVRGAFLTFVNSLRFFCFSGSCWTDQTQ